MRILPWTSQTRSPATQLTPSVQLPSQTPSRDWLDGSSCSHCPANCCTRTGTPK